VAAAEPVNQRGVMCTPAKSLARRGTILVVDDVADDLELARSIFEHSGFHVRLAADVDSALESATQDLPT